MSECVCVWKKERERESRNYLRKIVTRGNYGIFINGKLYVMFNHMDSYPEAPGLGRALVVELKWANLEMWKKAIANIKFCSNNTNLNMMNASASASTSTSPTEEDKRKLRPYTDLRVSSKSEDDWRCLTWKTQGSIRHVIYPVCT